MRAAARLNTWLSVLLVVLVLGALASALAIFLGGRAGLNLLGTLSSDVRVPAYTDELLGLAALLTLAWAALYVGVVNWARELLRRLAAWATTAPDAPAPDAVRAEQLRRTLSGWLTFGQWGTAATVVFSVALVPVSLALTRRLTEQFGADSSDFSGFGPGFEALQTASSLVSALPGVVIVWLILGAIKRFMNLAVQRARGLATAPVTPAATVVGNWFVLCMVLVGLGLLNLLLVGAWMVILGAVGWSQLDSLDASVPGLSGLLTWIIPLVVGSLVFAALIYGLYFVLLVLSRSYALSLGRLLDQGQGPAPLGPPATARPTGSAGDTPNVYRGYQ